MSTVTAKKTNPTQDSAIRCVPLSTDEAAANLRLCAVLRELPDAATGPLILLRQTPEARVILGEYPEGYAPKRETRVMVPMPHLKAKLPELAAYLDSLK